MRWGQDKRVDGFGRMAWWLKIGPVMGELSGPWHWAFQIYFASGVFQAQVWTWLLEIDWRLAPLR